MGGVACCMPKVELEPAGLKLSGVVEEEFLLLSVAAVLAAGGVLRPEPAPPRPQVAPPAPALDEISGI